MVNFVFLLLQKNEPFSSIYSNFKVSQQLLFHPEHLLPFFIFHLPFFHHKTPFHLNSACTDCSCYG